MACSRPFVSQRKDGSLVEVPCRHCLPCRLDYQSYLEFGLNLELQEFYKKGQGASFCRLSYTDDTLPLSNKSLTPSLRKKDLQDFNKRARMFIKRKYANTMPYKYLSCGEYGGSTNRPHYHIIFVGLSDYFTREVLRSCWKFGYVDVGTLRSGGIRYVLGYVTKSLKGQEIRKAYEELGIEEPFLLHSQNLGHNWIFSHYDELLENNLCYFRKGVLTPIPRYYREKYFKDNYSPDVQIFDPSKFIAIQQQEARNLGMDYSYFVKRQRLIRENELIKRSLNVDYTPVDTRDYHLSNRSYGRNKSVDFNFDEV